MPRIAVTGHLNLSAPRVSLVRRAIAELLGDAKDLTGISCLARGADTVFAEVVLELGGRLEVVLPSADYRATKVRPQDLSGFDALLGRAARVTVLPFEEAGRDAYEAANRALLGSCDELFAVWDGLAGVDRGSTASLVAQARRDGVAVRVIWPEGAGRT